MSDLSHHLKKETSFSKKEVFYVCIEEIKLIFTAPIKKNLSDMYMKSKKSYFPMSY